MRASSNSCLWVIWKFLSDLCRNIIVCYKTKVHHYCKVHKLPCSRLCMHSPLYNLHKTFLLVQSIFFFSCQTAGQSKQVLKILSCKFIFFSRTQNKFLTSLLEKSKYFSSMASKLIKICWIRTDSQPCWKITYSIVLQTIFHKQKNKNNKIYTSFVSTGLWLLGSIKIF